MFIYQLCVRRRKNEFLLLSSDLTFPSRTHSVLFFSFPGHSWTHELGVEWPVENKEIFPLTHAGFLRTSTDIMITEDKLMLTSTSLTRWKHLDLLFFFLFRIKAVKT